MASFPATWSKKAANIYHIHIFCTSYFSRVYNIIILCWQGVMRLFSFFKKTIRHYTELVPFSVRSVTHPPRTWKNPAKIGARNSSIAPTATCLGVRLRRPPSQPASNSQVETRKTRVTPADFRWVFPIPYRGPPGIYLCSGGMEC